MAQDLYKSYCFPHSLNRLDFPVELGTLERAAGEDKLKVPDWKKITFL